MKRRVTSLIALTITFNAAFSLLAKTTNNQPKSETSITQTQAANSIVGTWQGVLDVGVAKLRLALKIKETGGKLSATIDSLDQGANDIPVSLIAQDKSKVVLELQVINAKYEGELSADGGELKGVWSQGASPSLPLTFKRGEKPVAAAARRRPQTPQPPFPYDAEEVSYQNKIDNVTLGATLTLPRHNNISGAKKPKLVPAVLLITGSGAQDRDETLFGHKPFFVLADYLTRRGIAVLRVDDRGVGKSTGDFAKATSEDFARDAAAGIEFLKNHTRINPKQIGIIGHSEGGMIAPMVAAANKKDVAFIVLMAGTGVAGEEILYAQAALIAKASGESDENIKRTRALQENYFAVLKTEKDAATIESKLRAVAANYVASLSEAERKALPPAAIEATVKQLSSVWYRYFLIYDPRPTLRRVSVPVLAINGELDLQVPAKQNLSEIERALKAGGNRDVTIVELPRLNHLFQTSQTGAVQEYAQIEETISPDALKIIGDWIAKRVNS